MNREIPSVPPEEREKLNEGVEEVESTGSLFNDILKTTPLYTRLKVYLEMEYLNAILQDNDCCNDEEFLEANEWSKNVTDHIIRTLKEWERDGSPGRDLPDIKVPIG